MNERGQAGDGRQTASKCRTEALAISQEMLADGIFSLWICADGIARTARPGQFLSVYPKDSSKLLPRPISLCEIDRERGRLRLVYRVAGGGTREFSTYSRGERVMVLGPLGNGFPLYGDPSLENGFCQNSAYLAGPPGKALLIGGGVGIPPLLELAKQLKCETRIVLGYRGEDSIFLNREFAPYGTVYMATEDGSIGTRGTVMDVISERELEADVVYACGPLPMLRAVKAYSAKKEIECFLSLEERMACGIGACLACVCKTSEVDMHSYVKNKRICKDGPVFCAREVEL